MCEDYVTERLANKLCDLLEENDRLRDQVRRHSVALEQVAERERDLTLEIRAREIEIAELELEASK